MKNLIEKITENTDLEKLENILDTTTNDKNIINDLADEFCDLLVDKEVKATQILREIVEERKRVAKEVERENDLIMRDLERDQGWR